MSGIAGIICFDGKAIEAGLVNIMTAAMAHRGPDGIGYWQAENVALGHCMLCSTPSSLVERQPLANEDESIVLVMDGRIDNWEELTRALKERGVRLDNGCDVELVLRAYEIWGRACLEHIFGDFALVVWDVRQREAFCARDRMGNKPFFYHFRKNMLVFASEERAILALPEFEAELDKGRLAEFLLDDQYSLDRTIWKGITRLVSGNFLTASASGLRIEEYWSPSCKTTVPYRSIDELAEHYRSFVFDLTRRVGRSHKPVAYEVSGGLDSSALFLIADRLIKEGRTAAPDILGYTLAVTDDPDSNDLEYARAAARRSDRLVKEIAPTRLSLEDYVNKARIERTFAGFPNGAMSRDLRRSAKQDGAVSLITGVGGDEWLGSPWSNHPYYVEEIASGELSSLIRSFVADSSDIGFLSTAMALLRFGLWPFVPHGVKDQVRRLRKRNADVEPNWQRCILHPALYAAFRENYPDYSSRAFPSREYSRSLKMSLVRPPYHTWAWEQEESDAASIGLELRAPFRSAEMVEFSLSVPAKFLTRGKYDKFLHRIALQDCLPTEIAGRTDKATFNGAFEQQLSDAADFFEEISHRPLEWFGELSPRDLYAAFDNGTGPAASIGRGKLRWILCAIIACAGLAA